MDTPSRLDDGAAETTFSLPMFTQPSSPNLTDDGTPPPAPARSTPPNQGPFAPPSPKPGAPGAGATRTPASSVGDPKATAKVLAGLIGAVHRLGSALLSRFAGREIRKPTREQVNGVAEPTARILARRVDMAELSPDLFDTIEAISAAGDYALDGPVTRPVGRPEVTYAEDIPAPPPPAPMPVPESVAGPGLMFDQAAVPAGPVSFVE